MSLFEGRVRGIMNSAFGALYPDGKLHTQVETVNDEGDVLTARTDLDIKVQIDKVTETMKSDPGYSATDVALIVLTVGIEDHTVTTDDEITAGDGVRYRVGGPVRMDTARSHYIIRGVRD